MEATLSFNALSTPNWGQSSHGRGTQHATRGATMLQFVFFNMNTDPLHSLQFDVLQFTRVTRVFDQGLRNLDDYITTGYLNLLSCLPSF